MSAETSELSIALWLSSGVELNRGGSGEGYWMSMPGDCWVEVRLVCPISIFCRHESGRCGSCLPYSVTCWVTSSSRVSLLHRKAETVM